MLTAEYTQTMARYNRWQNRMIYRVLEDLSDEQRKSDQGVFFGSIHATLNHALWGDQLWLSRFTDVPAPISPDIPGSTTQYEAWDDLKRERVAFDEVMINWTAGLQADWFADDLTWFSGAANRDITKPRWLLVMQVFNHGTHHRGQVNAVATRFGLKPGATDIPFMPDDA